MTNLRNEIMRFQQRFDESFYEAWDRFNDLLRACPYHGFLELHQLDTFYNALNSNDQDSLNSAAGGNFLDKMPRECLKIIESKSKVRNSRSKPVVAKNQSQAPAHQTPASVKAVEESCVTCGGAHSYQSCPATDGNVYHDNIQAYVSQAAAANFNQGKNTDARLHSCKPKIDIPIFPPNQKPSETNKSGINFNQNRGNNFNQNRGNNFSQGPVYQPQVNQPPTYQAGQNLQAQLNNLATSNQRLESMLGVTTRSGVAYQGPAIPSTSSSSLKVMNSDTEVTKDTMLPTNNRSSKDVQPPIVQVQSQNLTSEPVVDPVSAPMPNQRTSIPFPSRRNDERRRLCINKYLYQINS
ncbi:hypothetical protein Tco_0236444 [Tanacetum coccineum]